MDLEHTRYQSLSACEAMAMDSTISNVIAEAFKGGLRTAFLMDHCNLHPEENVRNIKYYLGEAGVYLSDDAAITILVQALADVVRREESA